MRHRKVHGNSHTMFALHQSDEEAFFHFKRVTVFGQWIGFDSEMLVLQFICCCLYSFYGMLSFTLCVKCSLFDDWERASVCVLYFRYALDVNVERAEDVLMHKKLLQLARDPANRPAFNIHLVQVK